MINFYLIFFLLDAAASTVSTSPDGSVSIPISLFLSVICSLAGGIIALFYMLMKSNQEKVSMQSEHEKAVTQLQKENVEKERAIRAEYKTEYNALVDKYMALGDKSIAEIQASVQAREKLGEMFREILAELKTIGR